MIMNILMTFLNEMMKISMLESTFLVMLDELFLSIDSLFIMING